MIITEALRWFGLLTGWPVQLIMFKRKTYFEDRRRQGRIVRKGALIISNHYSVLDFVCNTFLFAFRKLHVVYAQTQSKLCGLGMHFFGGIPVDRSSYRMPFIDTCVNLLKRGRIVQIFPEAHISRDGNMLPFKPSYIYIALRAGVPIIPVILDGSYGIFKRTHVIMGVPILLDGRCADPMHPTHAEIAEINGEIYQKCLDLKADLDSRVAAKRKK